MSKKKAAGKLRQQSRTAGKRLGVKVNHGQSVSPGMVLVRQRGTKIAAGANVDVGRDHTLFSLAAGVAEFSQRRGKKQISVTV